MAQYPWFDISTFPQQTVMSDAVREFLQGQDRAEEMRLKRAELAQKARFENEQNANSARARDIQEKRDAVHEAQSQARAQAEAAKGITSLLGQRGRQADAQALAASSQFEDPAHPGRVLGAKLRHLLLGPDGQAQDYDTAMKNLPGQGPAPFMPGEVTPGQALGRFLGQAPKQNPLEPPPQGQVPSLPDEPPPNPTDAAEAMMGMPGMQMAATGAAAMQNKENQDVYQQQLDQRDQDQKAVQDGIAKRERWGLSFAGGPETIIDPEQARAAADADAKEKRDRLLAAAAREPDPQTRAAMMREAELIGAQASNATRSAVGNAALQSSSQNFKKEYGDLHDMTADEKYRIGMKPKGSGLAIFDAAKADKMRVGAMTAYDQAVQPILSKYGFDKITEQKAQLSDMFNTAGLAEQNSAAATLLKGRYAKFSQGAGVLTDQDMKNFYYDIGGKFGFLDADGNPDTMKISNLLKSYFEGTVDPRLVGQIERTLKNLERTVDARYKAIGTAMETRLRGLGADESTVKSVIATWLGPNYQLHGPGTPGDIGDSTVPGARGGARRAAPAPARAQGGGQPPMSIDDARKLAIERLRRDPNDAKAKAFLAKYPAQ